MKKLIKPIVCLAILLVAIALLTGCLGNVDKATGGGWFIDKNTGNKCTFGFNANLKDNTEAVNNDKIYIGQFQFKDHETGQKIHLEVMGLISLDDTSAYFGGYDKDGIPVVVFVEDLGEPGVDPGDYIEIYYDFDESVDPPEPSWAGVLEGGNIQTRPEL